MQEINEKETLGTTNQDYWDFLEILETDGEISLTTLQKRTFFRILEMHAKQVLVDAFSEMNDAIRNTQNKNIRKPI